MSPPCDTVGRSVVSECGLRLGFAAETYKAQGVEVLFVFRKNYTDLASEE